VLFCDIVIPYCSYLVFFGGFSFFILYTLLFFNAGVGTARYVLVCLDEGDSGSMIVAVVWCLRRWLCYVVMEGWDGTGWNGMCRGFYVI
jgi:hypothetical protein